MKLGLAALAACAWAATFAPTAAAADGSLVLKAGTIHLVEGGHVLSGNASVVVRDGKIVAAGVDLATPPGAEVVDYGPYAVIVPGLVSAGSNFGANTPSKRSADPTLRAIDNFDLYSSWYVLDVMGGVTTSYLAPARSRLVGGQGAVVKMAGAEGRRVLSDSASIHGTITAAARSVPSYWEPPVPATVDVGLGVAQDQLPGSSFGAIMALDELIALARGRVADSGEYGPRTASVLHELMEAGKPWRMEADSAAEIRALLDWSRREKLRLVLESAGESGALAAEIAAAGVPVIVTVDVPAGGSPRDFGRDDDARWPSYDNAAKLAHAGVEIAIAGEGGLRPRDLRFAAQVASRGGLAPDVALRAITLAAAKVLGVEARVGSIVPGKDADFCVLSGAPLEATSSVVATWIGGELAWKSPASKALVIEADELYLGDGEVLRPGQLSVRDGRIIEVGRSVNHPLGATVVRAPAAMPGMIDALGFLGLEGSTRTPQTDFKLARIIDAGDRADRRVAKSGVTTVVLTSRNTSDSGVPMTAYKPAAQEFDQIVIADPTALRFNWTDDNRLKSGQKLGDVLAKAKDYDKKWREYDEAMAKWVEPADEAPAKADADADKKEEATGDKKEESSDEKKEEKKDDKKTGKKGKEEEDADPVSGIWTGELGVPPFDGQAKLRLRLELDGERVSGSLRCDQVSASLVQLAGTWKEKQVALVGLGTRGVVRLEGEAKGGKFTGQLVVAEHTVELAAERETKELPVAKLPEIRKEKKDSTPEPKGKPKQPGVDERLEPFRRAMRGEGAIVVNVNREDEILACVAAFEDAGIKPVLYDAQGAWRVLDQIKGRVAGVILSQDIVDIEDGKGWNDARNRYAEVAAAGIPIAFHSLAEEGAAELPMLAAYIVSLGLSPDAALRGLTHDAARMLGFSARTGLLAPGLDADVLLLDGPPLLPSTTVLRAFVNGEEVE